jgi:hypothetical protein
LSKTWSGNVLGVMISILGCLAGYGAYRIGFEWGIVIGVGVALFGATIVNPNAVKTGASDFKDSASGLADLFPVKIGRREHDTVVLKKEEPLK